MLSGTRVQPVTRLLPAAMTAMALVLAAPLAVRPASAEAAPEYVAPMPSLAPIIAKVTPAVVSVSVLKGAKAGAAEAQGSENLRRFFQTPGDSDGQQPMTRPRPQMAAGSGVIVDAAKGYILTNNHVIDDAKEIRVTLQDRRELTAKLLGTDKDTDIALLQIDAKNLTALPVGRSRDLKVGDYVVAVGNPFGLGQTVTSGIVSATGRSGLKIEGYEDFIQTDASINPGNSGGALVNLRGELVGINTAIIGPSGGNVGIGFAVPSDMASGVAGQLVKYGEIKRGRLGVQVQDMTPALAQNLGLEQTTGALVEKVDRESPAGTAGLKAGDIVTAIDDVPIAGAAQLHNRVGMTPVGASVHLSVLRDGQAKQVAVTIGKPAEDLKVLASVERPTLEGASFAAGERPDGGVLVTGVERDSPAWQVGLRTNDLILAVNRTSVHGVKDLDPALKATRQAALFIKRGEERVVIVV